MTYQKALEKRKDYEYLIGKPFRNLEPDSILITHILIAPSDNPVKMLNNILANEISIELAVLSENINTDFSVYAVNYNSWDNIIWHLNIDSFLNN